jgi:hypothetical protein
MTTGFLLWLLGGVAGAVLLVGLHLWRNVRWPGPAARRWNQRAFALCQGVGAACALADWAYGPFLLSPLGLAFLGQPLLLVPSALALALLLWQHLVPGAYGVLFAGASLQTLVVVPILLVLERRLTMSFLSYGTLLALTASLASLFALVGELVQDVGPPDSWRGRVMLLHREGAYAGLQAVAAAFGLRWEPPRSILELGSARGRVNGLDVVIDSRPRLWPPRYRVEVRVTGGPPAGLAGPPPAPWQAVPGARAARVESSRDMPIDQGSLFAILAHLTETTP